VPNAHDATSTHTPVDENPTERINGCIRQSLTDLRNAHHIPNSVHASAMSEERITEGRLLEHFIAMSLRIRDANGDQLCVYKFGITANPAHRQTFYFAENYTYYEVLHASHLLESVSWPEAFLIQYFKQLGVGSCRNIRLGGDGALSLKAGDPNQVFFLYMACGRADSGRPIG
jgi:hypothetical protein